MQQDNRPHLQFFISSESECPYLPDRRERKMFAGLHHGTGEKVNSELSLRGFRRSQNVIYRPACNDCNACLSSRIRVADFENSRRFKRVAKRNKDVITSIRSTRATEEQFDLFRRYVGSRHAGGGMAEMDEFDFANMIEGGPVPSRLVEYRLLENGLPGKLIACCLTDVISNGLSMVYSFFDPEHTADSLGVYMVLDHIRLCNDSNLPYLYLGYWVQNSPKMAYKANYRPMEVFIGGTWQEIVPEDFDMDDCDIDHPTIP